MRSEAVYVVADNLMLSGKGVVSLETMLSTESWVQPSDPLAGASRRGLVECGFECRFN